MHGLGATKRYASLKPAVVRRADRPALVLLDLAFARGLVRSRVMAGSSGVSLERTAFAFVVRGAFGLGWGVLCGLVLCRVMLCPVVLCWVVLRAVVVHRVVLRRAVVGRRGAGLDQHRLVAAA